MKPFLVDVPVKVEIWIRPDAQKRQFEVLKQARPSIMFLISDGGRNEKEWEAIRANRKMIDEGIDWDCIVYRMYKEENNGLYTMGKEKAGLIWNHVDRCVFLEDDYVPSVSYFRFCAEMLEKYKDDRRVMAICGMNHEGVSENVPADYFFSHAGSIWGMATWKRVVEKRGWYQEHPISDPYYLSLLKYATSRHKNFFKKVQQSAFQENYEGHIKGGEFWYAYEMFTQYGLMIVPKYNLISNVGCTADAAHSDELKMLPRGIRRAFNIKTYELNFPLRHPDYVMKDVDYQKRVDRIMGNIWYIRIYREIECAFLTLRYKGISGVIKRTKKVIGRRTNIICEK